MTEHSTPGRIDFEKGSFQANGKIYTIEGGLTIERYAEFQILEKELAYGLTVKGLYDKLRDIYKLLNKQQFADAAVYTHNLTTGVAKLEEREPVVLKICALFCNYENEDRREVSDDLITAKIQDWKTEGLDMRDFFQLALDSVNGFLGIYREVAQGLQSPESGSNP